MNANKLYERKPDAETIAEKAARDFALRKAGIDPRTDAEKQADAEKLRQAKRWWNKTGGKV